MTQSNNKIQLNPDWKFKEVFPTISAYTTTWNCIDGKYPFEEAINSFFWVDELVVVDGGSTDGTRERLEELKKEYPNLNIYDIPLSENPGKDGEQKGMARAMCTSEFLIQFDSDEICVGDVRKWRLAAKNFPDNQLLQEMIVLEPFGSITNLRLNKEHNNLKWRLSKAAVEITHGIPDYDRLEKDGVVFSSGRSDGCFPIHIVTNKLIPSFARDNEKEAAFFKNNGNVEQYKKHIQSLIENGHPMILHLGHVNLTSKINLYLKTWHQWWDHLYQKNENIYFPGVALSDVTENMISDKIKELIDKTPSVSIPEIENLCFSTKTV